GRELPVDGQETLATMARGVHRGPRGSLRRHRADRGAERDRRRSPFLVAGIRRGVCGGWRGPCRTRTVGGRIGRRARRPAPQSRLAVAPFHLRSHTSGRGHPEAPCCKPGGHKALRRSPPTAPPEPAVTGMRFATPPAPPAFPTVRQPEVPP